MIESFGILNTLIPADDHPWYGIPFPGTYVTDADGIITAKFFENSLAHRVTSAELLRAALGEEVHLEPAAETASVQATATIDASPLGPGMRRELSVDVLVPPGQHVYGLPVPDGMVHAHAVLDDGPWHLHEVIAPPTMPHVLGTGEELQVYESSIRLRVLVSHNGSVHGDVTISGEIRWQACDDDQCFLPQSERFELPINAARALWMEYGDESGERTVHHLKRMSARRQ